MVEPIPGEPAALADCGVEQVLVVADYHAGIEEGLRDDGVEIPNRAADRRSSLLRLVVEFEIDRLVVLGDLGDDIGVPRGAERDELEQVFRTVTERVPITITKGNHDGRIESITDDIVDVDVVDGPGVRIGDVGFCHGHTWPDAAVVSAPTICTAHEHPLVRLTDEVGGTRTERVWLRGSIDPSGFPEYEDPRGELVVCPAFNDLAGGTVINEETEFLSPFLPAGLDDGDAYLLDGTRLGPYRSL